MSARCEQPPNMPMNQNGPRGSGRLECMLTTQVSYGLGRGYVAGFDFSGSLLGERVSGCGYLEYVDVIPTSQ